MESLATCFENMVPDEYGKALMHLQEFAEKISTIAKQQKDCLHDFEELDVSLLTPNADHPSFREKKSRRKRSIPIKSTANLNLGSDEEVIDEVIDDETSLYQKPKQTSKGKDVAGKLVTDFKGDERFQCDLCELKFSYYAALIRHLDYMHKVCDANKKIQEINKKAVSCHLCGVTLSSKGALHAHTQMHSGIQPFSCDVCLKKFSLKSNLIRHKRIHQGVKPYKCDLCGKGFTEKRSVEVHRRIHTGERPYSCDVCGMKFSQLGSWMGHKDTHNEKGVSMYACDVNTCGKVFSQKVGLLNHRKRHFEQKKTHKCSHCLQKFHTSEELRQHNTTHTKEKSFICAECGKCFSRLHTLKTHMTLHNAAIEKSKSFLPNRSSTSEPLTEEHRVIIPKINGVTDAFCSDGPSDQELMQAIQKGHVFL